MESCLQESSDSAVRKIVRGVAVLSTARSDIGVTGHSLEAEGLEHKVLGLRLKLPGTDAFIVASVYLQAGGGLRSTNRTLSATLARWQDEAQLPILAGGISI